MATVVLGAVGSAIGGPVGGFAGAAVGGYIDSTFLFPLIFGTQSFEGPRLTDLSLSSATEGTPIPYCLGPQTLVTGSYIWLPDLIEQKKTEDVGGKGGAPNSTQTSYTYFMNAAVMLAEAPEGGINAIREIWADSKMIWKNGVLDSRIRSISIYLGTDDQTPDSLMQEKEGTENVPAFKRRVYIVIEAMNLTDFGNRPPKISALLEAHEELTLAEGLGLVLERGGMLETDYDVTHVPGCLRGYQLERPLTGAGMAQQLMSAFAISSSEIDGKLTFLKRGDEVSIPIPQEDLTSGPVGQLSQPGVTRIDAPLFEVPTEVEVTFVDPNIGLERGSVTRRRQTGGYNTISSVQLPITLTSQEAREIADRALWGGFAEARQVRLRLPLTYLTQITEGSVLSVPTLPAASRLVRVASITLDDGGMLEVEGVTTQKHVYSPSVGSSDSEYDADGPYTPPSLTVKFFDVRALQSQHYTQQGMYIAVSVPASQSFRGASVFYDNGVDFVEIGTIGTSTYFGTVQEPLDGVDAVEGVLDRTNSVRIRIEGYTPTSVTMEQLLSGSNRMLIGSEVIGYQTVVSHGDNEYTLSNLMRGLVGTWDQVANHVRDNEDVIPIDSNVGFIEIPDAVVGLETSFKVVPLEAAIADVAAIPFTPMSKTLKPLPPVSFKGARDASGNLTITWARRSRGQGRILSSVGPPFDGTPTFKIEILGSQDTPVRTYTTSDTEVVYTAAQMTTDGTDGYTLQKVRAYETSTRFGDGDFTEALV